MTRVKPLTVEALCRRLVIADSRCVEIESKHKVVPEDFPDIRKFLLKRKGIHHEKTVLFFDQFLDTPQMDILRLGASLRIRYKGNGARVYLQYKGPGFKSQGLLYRSEFSTKRLRHVLMEESRHDIVHFADTSLRDILAHHVDPVMGRAMREHLGAKVVSRISSGPILSVYQKEKFLIKSGKILLEPSLDRIFAFHIGPKGPHPLSSFCEYENEIKSLNGDLREKLKRVEDVLEFDAMLGKKFDLRPEPLDKYHRSASFFLPRKRQR